MKLVFSFIVRVAFHFGSSAIDQLKAGVIVELLEYVCSGCYGDSNYLKEYELLIRKGLQSERQTIVMMSYSCFFYRYSDCYYHMSLLYILLTFTRLLLYP